MTRHATGDLHPAVNLLLRHSKYRGTNANHGNSQAGFVMRTLVQRQPTETRKTHFLNSPREKIGATDYRVWETAERATCSALLLRQPTKARSDNPVDLGGDICIHFISIGISITLSIRSLVPTHPGFASSSPPRSALRTLAASGRRGSHPPGTSAPQGNGHRLGFRLQFLSLAWE